MLVPIGIILLAIHRTCLITINLKKRFQTSDLHHHHHSYQQQQQSLIDTQIPSKLETTIRCNATEISNRLSSSFLNSHSSTTPSSTKYPPHITSSNRVAHIRRRRSRADTQMIILISINVAPFIIVHIITEIAYLLEEFSGFVKQSYAAKSIIKYIYLSWYLISATRFYTNCLLSHIYREEFKNRLHTLIYSCNPQTIPNDRTSSRRHSSKHYIGSKVNDGESTTVNVNSIAMT